MAMVVSLIIGVFGGYGPPLSTVKSWHLHWFWYMCPGVSIPPILIFIHVLFFFFFPNMTAIDMAIGGLFQRTHGSFFTPLRYRCSSGLDWIYHGEDGDGFSVSRASWAVDRLLTSSIACSSSLGRCTACSLTPRWSRPARGYFRCRKLGTRRCTE